MFFSYIYFIFFVSVVVFLGGLGFSVSLLEGAGGLCFLGLIVFCF